MKSKTLYALVGALVVLIAAVASLLLTRKTIVIMVNSRRQTVTTWATTVAGALKAAKVTLQPGDQVVPALEERLPREGEITIRRALRVKILADGQNLSLLTVSRQLQEILAEADIRLRSGDRLRLDGVEISPDSLIPPDRLTATLEIVRALPVTVLDGDDRRVIHSTAATLGDALEEAGILLQKEDRLLPEASTPLTASLDVTILRARPVVIHADGTKIEINSAAQTVAEALQDAGLTLEGLDYSQPAESEPIPGDGQIEVVRVDIEVVQKQESIPFTAQYQPAPDLEIDTIAVLQTGEPGLIIWETFIRSEDGKVVSREKVERRVAEPKPKIIGYGTKIVVRTVNTPSGKLEYWRKVAAYATSYSPCNLGVPNYCHDRTASGMILQKGVAATVRSWYNAMAGSRVYVPGYGTAVIADIGSGVSGSYWIDLGYSDKDYVSWHQNVTVYFLTPVPPESQILWILP